MDSPQLVQRLVESFTALADEVQDLTDRKTILEHKLRYAHEQVCNIASLIVLLRASIHALSLSALHCTQDTTHHYYYMMNISSRSASSAYLKFGRFLETTFTIF